MTCAISPYAAEPLRCRVSVIRFWDRVGDRIIQRTPGVSAQGIRVSAGNNRNTETRHLSAFSIACCGQPAPSSTRSPTSAASTTPGSAASSKRKWCSRHPCRARKPPATPSAHRARRRVTPARPARRGGARAAGCLRPRGVPRLRPRPGPAAAGADAQDGDAGLRRDANRHGERGHAGRRPRGRLTRPVPEPC